MENRIKLLRKQRGLTQKQLAAVVLRDPRTVSKWERSEMYPNISDLFKLADFFEVSVEYLYCHDGGTNDD